jgi:hypothetical protein
MAERRVDSYKSRDASGVRNDEHVIDAIYSQRIDRVPCPLIDNGSSQATGSGGDLEVLIKTGAAALFTFDGSVEELTADEELELFASAATILPATNDGVAWLVAARLQAGDDPNVELFAARGAVVSDPDSPEESLGVSGTKPAAGWLAYMQSLCPTPRHCALLGTVLVKRTGDTTITVQFEHAFQLMQRFKADGGPADAYAALLNAD